MRTGWAHRASLALVIAIAAPACGKSAANKAAACERVWQARAGAIDAAAAVFDTAAAGVTDRETTAKKNSDEIEKKLIALTVAYQDREIYPDKLKGVVAKRKMRLANMSPLKREPGKPATAIRYELEIQGEYKNAVKTIAALYDQPKAFQYDRVELNITDVYKKWSIIKAQGWVYEMPEPAPLVPITSPESAAFAASIGDPGATPECDGAPAPPIAAAAEAKRAALAARSDIAKRLDAVAALEARVATRKAVLDEIVRRRDDNRAAFTSHTDELLRRAQAAVTQLAELRFKANGDTDWR